MSRLIWEDADGVIRLTFDDGPHPDTTPRILDWLDANDQQGIFFLTGAEAERYPVLMDQIRSRGHQVANHGYHHTSGWRLSADDFVDNIQRGAEITDSQLFRPPYGHIGWQQMRTASELYDIMMWSVLSGDFDPKVNISKRMAKINRELRAGDILVFHDNPRHIERCMEMLGRLELEKLER